MESPLEGGGLANHFKRYVRMQRLKISGFHDLRHDFCSKLVQRGIDLYTVAALAGHRHVSTTQRYAHLSPEKLRSAIKVFNSDYNLTTMNKI